MASFNSRSSDSPLQNIKVVVRIRPLNNDERNKNAHNAIKCLSSDKIQIKEKKYTFDRVFLPQATQLEIYLKTIEPMISDVIAGYNCVIFAYGTTGTGKTYTMTGENPNLNLSTNWKEDEAAGCIPRTAAHIFNELASRNVIDYNIRVSFLELYNEEIRDLLDSNDQQRPINIFNDSEGSVQIQGLSEITVFNSKDINMLFQEGTNKRQTAATQINNRSSRSHTVFTITVHSKEINSNGEAVLKTGKISLADLAGSENIAKSGAKDKRAQESGSINKSLLTLSRIIRILAEKSDTHKHIPYRDSKLTRILQDSLGGSSKTCFIATISPSSLSLEETQNTLEYACRARDIENTPIINVNLTKKAVVQNVNNEIDKLKRDLDAATSAVGVFVDKKQWEELNLNIAETSNDLIQKTEIINELKRKIIQLEEMREMKVKEFDQTMNICQHNEKIINKAKKILKDLKMSLKQEKYVSSIYKNAVATTSDKAIKLEESSKKLLEENESLHDKLQHQYYSNSRNLKIINEKNTELVANLSIISNNTENIENTAKNEINEQLDLIMSSRNTLENIKGKMFETTTGILPIIESKFEMHMNFLTDVQLKTHLDEEIETISQVIDNTEKISLLNSNTKYMFSNYIEWKSSITDEKIKFVNAMINSLYAEKHKEEALLEELLRLEKLTRSRIRSFTTLVNTFSQLIDDHDSKANELRKRHKKIVQKNLKNLHEYCHTTLLQTCNYKNFLKSYSKEFSEKRDFLLNTSKQIETKVTNIIKQNVKEYESIDETLNTKLNGVEDIVYSVERTVLDHSSKIKDSLSLMDAKTQDNLAVVHKTGDTPIVTDTKNKQPQSTFKILSRTDLLSKFQETDVKVNDVTFGDLNVSLTSIEEEESANSESE